MKKRKKNFNKSKTNSKRAHKNSNNLNLILLISLIVALIIISLLSFTPANEKGLGSFSILEALNEFFYGPSPNYP
jgi:hypothetical protein|tara:strand:- start:1306 stop:1530 length:225 start_codon:yes stop_codon:yes gene_type:complete